MRFTDRYRTTIATKEDSFIIIYMDIHQRMQREGISNMFIVVTHSMAIKPLMISSNCPTIGLYFNRKSPITYLGHAIISVNGMSVCDNIHCHKLIQESQCLSRHGKELNAQTKIHRTNRNHVLIYSTSIGPMLICMLNQYAHRRKNLLSGLVMNSRQRFTFYLHQRKTRPPILGVPRHSWKYSRLMV